MGAESPDDPRIVAAVEAVCAAGRRQHRTVGMFLSRPDDVTAWHAIGTTLFLLGSDHGFLLSGATDLITRTNMIAHPGRRGACSCIVSNTPVTGDRKNSG